ncbi:MAG: helix-turn-helix domain-containing protein [Clostridia bacterium]|nr:helix-turn-helix domain-containing protein [Clostridia bacterium]
MKKDQTEKYTPLTLDRVIKIDRIVSLHYFEYTKGFHFPGERHDFWELVYIDAGRVEVECDQKRKSLQQGNVIFHKPNEYHNIHLLDNRANAMILSFYCEDEAMEFFADRILSVHENEKWILGELLKEGRATLSDPLNIVEQYSLEVSPLAPFGGAQMIANYLEQLLISFIRSYEMKPHRPERKRSDTEMINAIIRLLSENVYQKITLEDVAFQLRLSKTTLKRLFKSKTGMSVMEYYSLLKINAAKKLIAEGELCFTEIAEQLSFSSLHYFSHKFKDVVGMSPSAYAKSVEKLSLL